MKNVTQKLILVLLATSVYQCGGSNSSQTQNENNESTSGTNKYADLQLEERVLTSEEQQSVKESSSNSLGVSADGFDLQVLVRSSSLSLAELPEQENADAEATDESAESTSDEASQQKDEKAAKVKEDQGDEDEDADGDDEIKSEVAEQENDEKDAVEEEMEDEEVETCAKMLGVEVETLKIAGKNKVESLAGGEYLALKVTGSTNETNLLFANDPDAEEGVAIKGVCIIHGGTHNTTNIIIDGITIDKIVYKGRGNNNSLNAEIKEESGVGSIEADIKGNDNSLNFKGAGDFECSNDAIEVGGSSEQYTCEKS